MQLVGCLSCCDAAKAVRDGDCCRDATKLCSSWCRQGGWHRAGDRKALSWPCLHSSVPATGGESSWFISFCIRFQCCSWSLLLCSLSSILPCTQVPGRELLNVCVPHFFTLWLFCHFFSWCCDMLSVRWDLQPYDSAWQAERGQRLLHTCCSDAVVSCLI